MIEESIKKIHFNYQESFEKTIDDNNSDFKDLVCKKQHPLH